jgi:hypothetical protein
MKPFYFLCLFFISCMRYGYGQTVKDKKDTLFYSHSEKLISGSFLHFNVDAIGNIYVIQESGQIKKFTPQGDSSQVFQDVKRFGRPLYMEVSNPLKPYVFYPDFLTIVGLDRLLNLRNTINLRSNNHLRVSGIANAYDNQIWIYDELACRIYKINEQGSTLLESADLRNLVQTIPNKVNLHDAHGQLYLFDQKEGVYIFDYYGAFKKQMQDWKGAQMGVDVQSIYFIQNKYLHLINIKTEKENIYSLEKIMQENELFMMMKGEGFILKKDGVYRCILN